MERRPFGGTGIDRPRRGIPHMSGGRCLQLNRRRIASGWELAI